MWWNVVRKLKLVCVCMIWMILEFLEVLVFVVYIGRKINMIDWLKGFVGKCFYFK